MKRKYAVLMLGLTLSLASLEAYAEEANRQTDSIILEELSDPEEKNAETENELTESSKEQDHIYGKVVSIDETGITIELAEIPDPTEIKEETDKTELSESEENASTNLLLTFNGVNQIFAITDDTVAVLSQPIMEMTEAAAVPAENSEDERSDEVLTENELSEFSTTEEPSDTEDQTENSTDTLSDTEADIAAEQLLIPDYDEWESIEIDLKDIETDNLVSLTLDENGNAAVITVIQLNEQD